MKSAVALISNAIAEKRLDLAEEANNLAEKVLTATGVKVKASDRAGADKGSAATEYLIFIANRELNSWLISRLPHSMRGRIPRS